MNTIYYSLAIQGLGAELVKIEVDHYSGHPGTVVVGLGDTAVQESKERVRAALKNCGFRYPRGKVVVNLAPADVRKSGPCFDLAIALGIISLSYDVSGFQTEDSLFFGELSLDGTLRHVNGILSLVSIAKAQGFKKVFVPHLNAAEASLITGIEVYAAQSLKQMAQLLLGKADISQYLFSESPPFVAEPSPAGVDFSDIKGQAFTKRALEIAAAGSHNILMNGSPGSGKTMMAQALRGILPRMNVEDSLEVTKLYSLCGLLPNAEYLMRERPFRTVHHTASGAAIVGGGRVPKPGEISLAHRGVLFLDEVAEFPNNILEMLRQPLEDKQITISRTAGSLSYPSSFLLCGAMNPCPCGYYQVPQASRVCDCSPFSITRYKRKISGPFLDRIDLHCMVSPVHYQELKDSQKQESSDNVRSRVEHARSIQLDRFRKTSIRVNAEMSAQDIATFCSHNDEVSKILEKAMTSFNLSARGYHRVLKVSRTIADLEDSPGIKKPHVLEALQYRLQH